MREIKIGDKTILAVEVPEDAHTFVTEDGELYFKTNTHYKNTGHYKKLPSSNYEILGRASEITEEQAKGMVEKIKGYEEYLDYDDPIGLYCFDTALESWKSFMRTNNIKDTQLILIRK